MGMGLRVDYRNASSEKECAKTERGTRKKATVGKT